MSGPEIEANAIDTVLRGMPLHGTPRWAGLLIVLALGFLPALVSLRLRPLVAVAVVPAIAFVFLFIAQRAFDARAHPAGRRCRSSRSRWGR